MSRREEDKRKSLSFLGKIADQAAAPFPAAKPAARPPPPPPRPQPAAPAPKRAPTPPPAPTLSPSAYQEERRRRAQMEERKAKLEEERMLKQRRQNELHRNANLEWRGMDMGKMGAGVRRTAFDRVEPTVTQKIEDVLGAAKEKESRVKNREKGRRMGG